MGQQTLSLCPECGRLQNRSQASFGKIPTQQEQKYNGIMSLDPKRDSKFT